MLPVQATDSRILVQLSATDAVFSDNDIVQNRKMALPRGIEPLFQP